MIACFDVDYKDEEKKAQIAGIILQKSTDETPLKAYTLQIEAVAPYEPGAFYKRELPCILQLLNQMTEPIDLIIVDSYVWLEGSKKGLGAYLFEALAEGIPVIGVAKSKFRNAAAIEVYRGDSQKPLFVTAAGISPAAAAWHVQHMAGPYRFPALLKYVDSLCREW